MRLLLIALLFAISYAQTVCYNGTTVRRYLYALQEAVSPTLCMGWAHPQIACNVSGTLSPWFPDPPNSSYKYASCVQYLEWTGTVTLMWGPRSIHNISKEIARLILPEVNADKNLTVSVAVENTNWSIIGNYRLLCEYKNRLSCPTPMFTPVCNIKENAEDKLQEHGFTEGVITWLHMAWINSHEGSPATMTCPIYAPEAPTRAPSQSPTTTSTSASIPIRFAGWSWLFIFILHVFLHWRPYQWISTISLLLLHFKTSFFFLDFCARKFTASGYFRRIWLTVELSTWMKKKTISYICCECRAKLFLTSRFWCKALIHPQTCKILICTLDLLLRGVFQHEFYT